MFTGHVESGLPDFKSPSFESRVGNETYTFVDMASKLGSGILVVPLLSILENISLAKFFGEFVSNLTDTDVNVFRSCLIL